jgi:hypothetical protein
MKTKVKFTALGAVCMALASVSLAEPHSHTIPDSTLEKTLTSADIASLMHWELRKLPITSATEDAREFLRVAKEHEEELPSRFDRLSQELEAKGVENFSDDISKGEYQKTWESIVKDTLEHSLNPEATPLPQPSPSVYYTGATHAKPSATPSVSAYSSSESGTIAIGGLFIALAFLIGSIFFYFLPSIIAGNRHHHNGGAVFYQLVARLDSRRMGCSIGLGTYQSSSKYSYYVCAAARRYLRRRATFS